MHKCISQVSIVSKCIQVLSMLLHLLKSSEATIHGFLFYFFLSAYLLLYMILKFLGLEGLLTVWTFCNVFHTVCIVQVIILSADFLRADRIKHKWELWKSTKMSWKLLLCHLPILTNYVWIFAAFCNKGVFSILGSILFHELRVLPQLLLQFKIFFGQCCHVGHGFLKLFFQTSIFYFKEIHLYNWSLFLVVKLDRQTLPFLQRSW